MRGKFALLLGNDQYLDEQFHSLTVPGPDVKELKKALKNPSVGDFDHVQILLNGTMEEIIVAIGELFADRHKDDLLLLYFSGHGALDQVGQLYLAVAKTKYKKLESTAIWVAIIKNIMNRSRSRRQVLILDCCHSGAFGRDAAGAKSALNTNVINESTFEVKGYGRHILTSSSATQLSWEGNKVIDKTENSLFTHFIVEGLTSGKAAVEGNQEITVENLYDYAFNKVLNTQANMTPQRWMDKQQGHIVIAKNPHPKIKQKPQPVTAQHLAGSIFCDKLKIGEIGPEMVVIPKGKFSMGDIQGDGNVAEKPVHLVHIEHPFALSKYPLTFEDYAVFVKDKGVKQPDDKGWGLGNRPIINVSWNNAVAYAQWLSKQTGKVYRLPSEAEWEYAARAGTETAFWWGDNIDVNIVNCAESESKWSGRQTSPVDSFEANPNGLYDMLGNVWEWVQDSWHDNYYGAPHDGSAWKRRDTSPRVLRGGAWNSYSRYVHSATRNKRVPGYRNDYIGFRLARDL